MRVAVVHDWLNVYAGSEKVLEQILKLVPEADVYALVDFLPDDQRGFLNGKAVTTSKLQHMPFARKHYRQYLAIMPLMVEQFNLSQYDLVISSSHAVAKGVITGPGQVHVCYCHSPIRYAWDLQHQYLAESRLTRGLKSLLARMILHYIRLWDVRTSNGVDTFVANSSFVARRIQKTYRRDSVVIYPPVDVSGFQLRTDKEDFYLTASRFVPYKRIDLIVEAFTHMPDKKLVVIGDGPDYNKVKMKAGSNVELLGYQPTEVLRDYMQRARGFVFAAEEDFGIIPVEAQACGTPVIGYGRGGLLDTVIPNKTGVFFDEQSIDSIVQAVNTFESTSTNFSPAEIRTHAESFSTERFVAEFDLILRKATGQLR